MKLRLEPTASTSYDDVYARLLEIGASRSEREAHKLLFALVLVLINQIGEEHIVHEAIDFVQTLADAQHQKKETTC